MIKSFSVTCFKNFKDTCTIDFANARDYDFNRQFIKNGLINKALLYGKNGSGKSNLGFAIMDLTTHLIGNTRGANHYLSPLNGDSDKSAIQFQYVFQFGESEIIYEYEKDEELFLSNEQIRKNGELVFAYDYQTNNLESKLKEVSTLSKQALLNRNIENSVLKTIYRISARLIEDSPIKLIYEFAKGMLRFGSLDDYALMKNDMSIEKVEQYIASDSKKMDDFSLFLDRCGLHYDMQTMSLFTDKYIYVKFKNRSYPLFQIASIGTKVLSLFFYWLDKMKGKITFLYLDDYDAFYHFSLAKTILQIINENDSYQSIITTNNPYLADNAIMRPDCYLNLKDGKVKSFADSTNRIIRQGNSLEKMVLTDAF